VIFRRFGMERKRKGRAWLWLVWFFALAISELVPRSKKLLA